MIKDSGSRVEFSGGAVRDIKTGKGRCDLMPLMEISQYLVMNAKDNSYISVSHILSNLSQFIKTGNVDLIYECISTFVDDIWHISSFDMLLELAIHYEEGTIKYGERNWEKGIPWHSFLDSGIRHLLKYCNGYDDESHNRAFVWNMFGLIWTVCNKPNLNDLNTTYS